MGVIKVNFQEWFNENYGDMFFTNIAEESVFKNGLKSAWQAALQSQWQPIETAPKDVPILLHTGELGENAVVGMISSAGYNNYHPAIVSEYGDFAVQEDYFSVIAQYWQPLPPLPLGV